MFGLSVSATSVLLGALMFLIFVWFVRRPRNLPPGPWSWPVIGYIFRPGLIHEAYMDMAKKCGPIFSLRRGPFLVVVLNDMATIRQALVKSAEFFPNRFVPGHIRWGVPDTNKNGKLLFYGTKTAAIPSLCHYLLNIVSVNILLRDLISEGKRIYQVVIKYSSLHFKGSFYVGLVGLMKGKVDIG